MENDILFNCANVCNSEKYVKKYDIQLHIKITKHNLNFKNIRWAGKVYNYINNIFENPKCPMCGNDTKFENFNKGYLKFCSAKCSANSPDTKELKKLTSIKHYGTEHPMQNKEYFENYSANILIKYGVDNLFKSEEIKDKIKNSLITNHGVDTPFKSQKIKDKAKQTTIEHWGVENVSQAKEIIEKRKQSSLKRYGTNYTFQAEEVKNKMKITIKNKYGVDHYVQSKENKLLIKNGINGRRIEFWADFLKIDINDIIISGTTFIINNCCEIHKSFEINRYNLYNRAIVYSIENICTLCNPISENASIKENEIRNFIENNLKIKTEKIKINKKEIDINIPSHKIGIEFNGLYWHSYKRKNDMQYHLNKTIDCEKNNIELLHIFEDEWILQKEIVKSIIKNKLSIFDEIININDCEIKEINLEDISEFLDDNHIQGSINSKINIGLFNNNELVSVVALNNKRSLNINENEYELLRFCNKININIVGSINKMLNYFYLKYKPKSIITFVDRRYSQGELYKSLGFKFIKNTEPNYWYFKCGDLIREHRYNFRKEVLVKEGYDETKSELEIMTERNYLKIYDCGSIILERTF